MIFILACIIIFICFNQEGFGYSETSPLYTHFIYQFMHINIMHLSMNLFSFYTFYKVFKGKFCLIVLLYSYASSVIASFLSEGVKPTVGCSGLVFALIGIYTYLSLTSNRIKKEKKYQLILNYSLTILFPLAIMYFIPYINTRCHFYSLIFGVLSGFLISKIKVEK